METLQLIHKAVKASRLLRTLDEDLIPSVLEQIAVALSQFTTEILTANRVDLERMDPNNPKYDRLKLTEDRIQAMAADMLAVANLPSPVGRVMDEAERPNGMRIRKVSVPFGVIGIIYEARPNVTTDVFSLCLRSGNACVLKGGTDAEQSNRALVRIISNVLSDYGIEPAMCTLLPSTREATHALLHAEGLVDLIIPRGGQSLIRFVRENARIPVIETGAGVCHTYFDATGDSAKGKAIVKNAKTRRVSVCNALDCLLVHQDRLADIPSLCEELAKDQVIIYADKEALDVLTDNYPEHLLQPATDESFGTEFLDYKMSLRVVKTIEEALEHISTYSSGHSECIVAESPEAIRLFEQMVDAGCVYANVSTAFTDGAQFGMGGEIGISTQKLHARGPMGLKELTTYKYIIEGEGQIRTN